MRYFSNAKDALNPDTLPIMVRKMIPHTMYDMQDRLIDANRNAIARRGANEIRFNAFADVLTNHEYGAILMFAPENHRCMYCGHWKMQHTEDYFNGYKWTMHCIECTCNGFAGYGSPVVL